MPDEKKPYNIKVTGERVFESGSKRDPNSDKGRYDLISPMFIRRLAKHTQTGGQHRGDRNWEKGMPMSATLDSAIRHLYDYLYGDRSEDHLAATAWGMMNLMHHEDMIKRGLLKPELNDLPDYTGKAMAIEDALDAVQEHRHGPAGTYFPDAVIELNKTEIARMADVFDSGYCGNHGEYNTLEHENCPRCAEETNKIWVEEHHNGKR